MAYDINNWVDQEVERPKTYDIRTNTDGSVTLIDSFGLVSELGTPVNADNMNHIEEGIAACDLRKYSPTETYNTNEWVTAILDGEKKIYRSLQDNNYGHPVTDYNYWEEVSLGGGGGLEIGDVGMALYIDESKGKRRWLNGSVMSINANTQPFVNWLKKVVELVPSLATTETNWQAEAALSVYGQCGKFVIDEESATVRLPKVVNIQGLQDLTQAGVRVAAGLPALTPNVDVTIDKINVTINKNGNHKHSTTATNHAGNGISSTGSGWGYDNVTNWGDSSHDTNTTGEHTHTATATATAKATARLNDSTGIYGASNTVQPEAIQYIYFIQIATGSETEVDITNEIELNNPYSLGDSKYSPIELNNLSWLKSEGQWNSGTVYDSFYNWVLTQVNNGVEGFKLSTATDITDYDFVVNTSEMTFRLPLLDGSESIMSDKEVDIDFPFDPYEQSDNTFTAPANGWYSLYWLGLMTDSIVQIKGSIETKLYNNNIESSGLATLQVSKGEVVTVQWSNTWEPPQYFKFIYAQGNGSLYYYVGETVQNANLIDAGRISEEMASKANISNTVTTNTEQEITASKTMTGVMTFNQLANSVASINVVNPEVQAGVSPSANKFSGIDFCDSAGNRMGRIEHTVLSNGSRYINVNERKDPTSSEFAQMIIGYDTSNKKFCTINGTNLNVYSFPTNTGSYTMTVGATQTSYTAPADGWISVYGSGVSGATNVYVAIYTYAATMGEKFKTSGTDYVLVTTPVYAGQQYTINYANMNTITQKFFPTIGA